MYQRKRSELDTTGEMSKAEDIAVDRRVRRTQHALKHALFELIVAKGYERVTVRDVIAAADVGRSTFYVHYRDKEDLFLSSLDDEVRAALRADEPNSGSSTSRSLLLFQHAGRHQDLYRALVRKRGGWPLAATRMEDTIAELFEHRLAAASDDAPVPPTAAARFLSTALIGLLSWWLYTGMEMTPEEIDDAFRRLANRGVRGALGVTL